MKSNVRLGMLKETIFREYDIRGIVGTEIVVSEIYNLSCALIVYFFKRNPLFKRIVIGMDGRLHSPAIKQEMQRALCDAGVDVIFIGVCASPVLYYAVHTLSVDAGLMITASHNPAEYNGIKICFGKESVWGAEIRHIKDLYFSGVKPSFTHNGAYEERDIIPSYVDFLKQQFVHLLDMDLSLIIDCGNGSAGTVMPQLCASMRWPNVRLLYPEVDGTYPNHEADPVKEENMADVKQLLQKTDAVLGIGFDGDCDRMAAMTKEGFLVPGDQLLALFAQPVLEMYPGAVIVSDIKSSSVTLGLISEWGGNPILSPSGHAIIKDVMTQNNALLAGELSCHFFFADRYFGYDDAFYALLRLCELIYRKKTLEQLLTAIPHAFSSPEYRVAYDESLRESIIAHLIASFKIRSDLHLITLDGVRASAAYGWGLVRVSNTQPLLCLRFESKTVEGLAQIKKDFMLILEQYLNPLDVKRIVN
jgi:phosphomannomutase / phosphoglucomutase